jgi:hypothetical protein
VLHRRPLKGLAAGLLARGDAAARFTATGGQLVTADDRGAPVKVDCTPLRRRVSVGTIVIQ